MKFSKCSHLSFFFILSLMLFSCGEQATQNQREAKAEVNPPEQIITLNEAKTMYNLYTERRANLIQKYEDSLNISKKDTTKFDVARYTFYDYKTIKQYLEYIDQEASEAGVEISSLRFYYSNYPDEGKFADGTPIVHPRQNSFFIIPALKQNEQEYAFTIEDNGEGGKKAVLLNWELDPVNPEGMGSVDQQSEKAYAGFSLTKPASTITVFRNGGTVLNHGNAAPPPYQ